MATICCQGHTFEQIQAVLFDKDGTLADVEAYLKALGNLRSQLIASKIPGLRSQLLAAFGLEGDTVDPTGLLAVGSRYENEVATAAYIAAAGQGWIAAIATVQKAFQKAEESLAPKVAKTPPLEGASSLLKRLKSADIKLGIVSSDAHVEVAAFIEQYQLTEISWYCGAAPTALPKTHPSFLQMACEAMAVSPLATLVIGDSAADLALARQGAAGFVGMTGGWQRSPSLESTSATCENLAQVESFS